MIPASSQAIQAKGACFFLCAALVVLLLATAAAGQIANPGIDDDPASGMRNGTNTIEGRVSYPSGRQLDRRYTVRLSSVVVGEFSTITDNNGIFTFRRLREGTYSIRIDVGKEYQSVNETVDFYDNRGRTMNVPIELRPRPASVNKPGVVSAAIAGVPRPALELYNQAIASAEANDSKKAIEQFKAAVALYPSFVLALNELGILYMNLGDLEHAAQALTQATKAAPDNFTLRLNLGYVLMQMKKFAEAETELHRATDLNNTAALPRLYRGRVLISLRKYGDAEKELQRVIGLGGVHVPVAYRYLGALFKETGNRSRAIESLEKYLALATKAKDIDEVREIIKQLRNETVKLDK